MAKKDQVTVDTEVMLHLKSLLDSMRLLLEPLESRLNTETAVLKRAVDMAERGSRLLQETLQGREDE
jgi:predicted lipid carrier protein YhbT